MAKLQGQIEAYEKTIQLLTGRPSESKHGNLRSVEDLMLRELGFPYGHGFRRGY